MLPSVGVSFRRSLTSDGSRPHYAANLSAGLGSFANTPFVAVGYDLTQVKVAGGAVPAPWSGKTHGRAPVG